KIDRGFACDTGRLQKHRQPRIGSPGSLFDHDMGIGQHESVGLDDGAGSSTPAFAAVRMSHDHDDGRGSLFIDIPRGEFSCEDGVIPYETACTEYHPCHRPHEALHLPDINALISDAAVPRTSIHTPCNAQRALPLTENGHLQATSADRSLRSPERRRPVDLLSVQHRSEARALPLQRVLKLGMTPSDAQGPDSNFGDAWAGDNRPRSRHPFPS